MNARTLIDMVVGVTHETLAELTETVAGLALLELYESCADADGEPTDLSCELGDALEALYHFYAEIHRGQGSIEYAALSQVSWVFKPGIGGIDTQGGAFELYAGLLAAEETWREASARLAEYRDNEPGPHRLIKRRESASMEPTR